MSYAVSEDGERVPKIRQERLLQALRDGCTLIIDRCQSFFPGIADVCRTLSQLFSCQVSANLYASWTRESGFGLHYDDHDVIALQISGSKRWQVHAPTHTDPLPSQKSFFHEPPSTPALRTVDLLPGELMYVPCGYWHDVETVDSPSLHVSFAIPRLRYHDVARQMLETLQTNPLFRRSLPLNENVQALDVVQTEVLKLFATSDMTIWAKAVRECALVERSQINFPQLLAKEVTNG